MKDHFYRVAISAWVALTTAVGQFASGQTYELLTHPRSVRELTLLSQSAVLSQPGSRTTTVNPAMNAIFDLAARDPNAAFAELRQTYPDGAPEGIQASLAAFIFEKDFTKAPEVLPQISNRAMQFAFGLAIPKLYARDGAGTLAVIRDKLPEEAKADAMYWLIRLQVDAGDWTSAMHNQLSMAKSNRRLQALSAIAGRSGSPNLEAALNWMREMPDDEERKLAHTWIVDNLGQVEDDAGLLRLLAVTPVDEPPKPGGSIMWNRAYLIRRIAWIRQNRGAALDQLRGLISVEEQPEVDSVLIAGDTSLPPAERIARLLQIASTEARNAGISWVVGEEWKNNPQQAIEIMMSLPEKTFGAAFRATYNQWKDKVALSQWIKALPAGFQREQAIRTFVVSLQPFQIPRRRGGEKDLAAEVATWAADPNKRDELERYLKGEAMIWLTD